MHMYRLSIKKCRQTARTLYEHPLKANIYTFISILWKAMCIWLHIHSTFASKLSILWTSGCKKCSSTILNKAKWTIWRIVSVMGANASLVILCMWLSVYQLVSFSLYELLNNSNLSFSVKCHSTLSMQTEENMNWVKKIQFASSMKTE